MSPNMKSQHGIFDVDLFAKASADANVNQTTSPFLIAVSGDPQRTKHYTAQEQPQFFADLATYNIPNNPTTTCWVDIDFSVLTEHQYNQLCQLLQMHAVTKRDCYVEDVSVTDTKISNFIKYSFCIVDTLVHSSITSMDSTESMNSVETRNLNVIKYNQCVVSLHRGAMPGPSEMYTRIVDHHRNKIPSVEWIQWCAFDCLLGSLIPHIDQIVQDVEEIDQQSIPVDPNTKLNQSEILRNISMARKKLRKLTSSLSSKIEVLSVIIQQTKSKSQNILVHLLAVESEVKWKIARVKATSET